ncbi:MAG: hypothetical protein AAGI71_05530 [Bacteroidota bacterium]
MQRGPRASTTGIESTRRTSEPAVRDAVPAVASAAALSIADIGLETALAHASAKV